MTPHEIAEIKTTKFENNQLARIEYSQETVKPTSTHDKHSQESLIQKHRAENPAEPWYFAHIWNNLGTYVPKTGQKADKPHTNNNF